MRSDYRWRHRPINSLTVTDHAPIDARVVARILSGAGDIEGTEGLRDELGQIAEESLIAAAEEVGLSADAVRRSIAVERLGHRPQRARLSDSWGRRRCTWMAKGRRSGRRRLGQSRFVAGRWPPSAPRTFCGRGTASGAKRSGLVGATVRTIRNATGEGKLGDFERINATVCDTRSGSSVVRITKVAGLYAQLLADRGFITLAFDHRNFGAQRRSAPATRRHVRQARRPRPRPPASSPNTTLSMPNGSGASGSAWVAGMPSSTLLSIVGSKRLTLVAAAFNDPKDIRAGMGDDNYRSMMLSFAEVTQREYKTGETDFIKAVSDVDGEDAAMPGAEPFEYYGTARSAALGWKNQMTRLSIHELLTFKHHDRSRLRRPDADT